MVCAMQADADTATETTLSRLRDWIARSGRSYADIAAAAGVDEKSVRQARHEGWNPRATTLKKLEAVLPKDWPAGEPVSEPLPADAEASVPPVVQPDWQPAHAGDHKIEDRQ